MRTPEWRPSSWRARALLSTLAFALAASIGLYACASGPVVRPDGGQGLLPLGSRAPDVAGDDLQGRRLTLASGLGRPSVVYFYPKNETPGCTKEACAFRDKFGLFEAQGVHVFAVSQDSEESHRQFRAKFRLPFVLVADTNGSLGKAYGVETLFGLSARVTFIINAEGRIARVFRDVDPAVHADEVLAVVKDLQAAP